MGCLAAAKFLDDNRPSLLYDAFSRSAIFSWKGKEIPAARMDFLLAWGRAPAALALFLIAIYKT